MTKEKANRNEVVGMFLTYCRKTLVNARTDVLRERKRRRNREVLFCDLRRSELESLADWQDVPERETVFDAAGKPIGVTDKDLADALEKLCPEEQAIILLDYFNDFMDGLCTGFYTDADGFWDYGIDLSMKSFMQAKLLRAMLRFKP